MLENLFVTKKAQTRSISPENPTGEKSKGATATEGMGKNPSRDLGIGWKVSPCIKIKAKETVTIADISGEGKIEQIWMTPTGNWRFLIIRFFWDDQPYPSVETPVGDFFAAGLGKYHQISSLAVCFNPGSALNCYWPMPFRKKCRITIENISEEDCVLYNQINYSLEEIPKNSAYFHASFRRTNPLPYKEVYTIIDNIKGSGHYVGTYLLWGTNNSGWWGEGEIKFYIDGDLQYPTICGTGTEDYFCGSYNFENKDLKQYQEFSTPYSGFFPHKPDGLYNSQTRFEMYRWHILDPIRFEKDLKVTIQALGWRSGGRYLPLQDDISSVAFWYQTLPSQPLDPLPEKDQLEII